MSRKNKAGLEGIGGLYATMMAVASAPGEVSKSAYSNFHFYVCASLTYTLAAGDETDVPKSVSKSPR